MRKQASRTPFSLPSVQFPKIISEDFHTNIPLSVQTYEFYTVSDGKKRSFTNADALKGYGIQRIENPEVVSYTNLFINGVLQPQINYQVTEGEILIKTEDVPPKGVPIILQMVKC